MICKNNIIPTRAIPALLCLFVFFACQNREQTKDGQLILQAGEVIQQQPDSALAWLRSIDHPQELSKSQQADYYLLLARAIVSTDSGLFRDSLTTELSASIDWFLQQEDDEKLAWAYFLRNRTLYDANRETGDSEKAILDCLEAAKYAGKINNQTLLSQVHRDMGDICYARYLFNEALDYYKKSKQYFENEKQPWQEMLLCGKMGSVYNNLKQYDSALVYQRQALDYALAAGDTSTVHARSVIASLYKNIGFSYRKKGDIQAEKNALLQAYRLSPKVKEAGVNIILYSLSRAYANLQQPDSAFYYAGLFTEEADETPQEKALRAHHWYKLYKETGNYPFAMKNLESFVQLCDTIFKEELSASVLEIQKKYDKEALENEYNQVLVQRLYLVVGIIAVILLGVVAAWVFRNRIRRREIELQEAEQALQTYKGMLDAHENRMQSLTERYKQQQSLLTEQAERLQDYHRVLTERDEKSERLRAILAERLDIAHRVAQMNVVSTDNTRAFMKQFHKAFGKNLLDWESIRPVINGLYDGFVDKMQAAHPETDGKDLQLCCFIRAGFRTEELAVLLDMTQSSVRVKQTRLVKKMGFGSADAFHAYLTSL